MDDDDEYDVVESEILPAPLSWADVVGAVLAPVQGFAQGASQGVSGLREALMMHSLWVFERKRDARERQDFAADADAQIRALTGGDS